MRTRCPRCQFEFDAASAWVQCPRCGGPFTAAPAPPAGVAGTQALDPAAIAQVMRASASPHSAPPAATPSWQPAPAAPPAWQVPPTAPAWQAPAPAVYRAPPAVVADDDLAGRAVVSVVLSIIAMLGGCNPVGLVGVTLGLMAYAAANDQRVELAQSRGRTARRVAWVSLFLTAIVWTVVLLSIFYEW